VDSIDPNGIVVSLVRNS